MIPIENNSWDYVQRLIEREINSAFKLRIKEDNNKMKFKEIETQKSLRATLKKERLSIIEKRTNFKNAQRNNDESYALQTSLESAIGDYRHLHIAYSLMNGKSYDQIERTCRTGNEPSWFEINNYLSNFGLERSAA